MKVQDQEEVKNMGTILYCHDEDFNDWARKKRDKYLQEIEFIYGTRDTSYNLSECFGVRICSPTIIDDRHTQGIVIILTQEALKEWQNNKLQRAAWQLAHECIHLLDPRFEEGNTIVLEESLATRFQYQIEPNISIGSGNNGEAYIAAFDLVSGFMGNGYLPEKVRQLRKEKIRICDITFEDLMRVAPEIGHDTAKALTKEFQS